MTLKEILRKRYNEVTKLEPRTSDFDSFYNSESRKLTEIFGLLRLDEWTEKLKSNGEYNFSQKGADFVTNLFKEYSGKGSKLDAIRRMDYKNFDSSFVKYLYYGFMEMFREAGASPEELSQIDLKLQELLLADFHIAKVLYNRTKAKLDKFFKDHIIVDISDYTEFLKHFAFEFEKLSAPFIERMRDLAEAMSEIRLEECTDYHYLQNEFESMTPEEEIWMHLEFEYLYGINDAIDNDEELKNLTQKYASLQNPDTKKPPFQNKIKKPLKELETKIFERKKEIETRIIEEEHTKKLQSIGKMNENERFTLPKIENPYTPSSEKTLYSHDVLLLALERLKEDDENSENYEVAPK